MDFKEASNEIKKDLEQMRSRLKKSFINSAYSIEKGIVQKFYNAEPGSSSGVAFRSGSAARSWRVDVKRDGDNLVANIYSAGVSYANFNRERNIKPKNRKWLAIPVNKALTMAGVARFKPREADNIFTRRQSPGGGFRKSNSDVLRFHKKDSETAFLILKDNARGLGLPFITSKNRKNNTNNKDKSRILFVLKKNVKVPAKNKALMPWVDSRANLLFSRLTRATKGSFVQ